MRYKRNVVLHFIVASCLSVSTTLKLHSHDPSSRASQPWRHRPTVTPSTHRHIGYLLQSCACKPCTHPSCRHHQPQTRSTVAVPAKIRHPAIPSLINSPSPPNWHPTRAQPRSPYLTAAKRARAESETCPTSQLARHTRVTDPAAVADLFETQHTCRRCRYLLYQQATYDFPSDPAIVSSLRGCSCLPPSRPINGLAFLRYCNLAKDQTLESALCISGVLVVGGAYLD